MMTLAGVADRHLCIIVDLVLHLCWTVVGSLLHHQCYIVALLFLSCSPYPSLFLALSLPFSTPVARSRDTCQIVMRNDDHEPQRSARAASRSSASRLNTDAGRVWTACIGVGTKIRE